eukprot:989501-Pelagomonas_calceolata.AAC.3
MSGFQTCFLLLKGNNVVWGCKDCGKEEAEAKLSNQELCLPTFNSHKLNVLLYCKPSSEMQDNPFFMPALPGSQL